MAQAPKLWKLLDQSLRYELIFMAMEIPYDELIKKKETDQTCFIDGLAKNTGAS